MELLTRELLRLRGGAAVGAWAALTQHDAVQNLRRRLVLETAALDAPCACPPLPPCCFPCRRVRAVLRASPLDTFVSVMSGSKLMEAHGVASEMRFVEAVDDHTVTTGWVAHKNVLICG